MWLMTIGTAIVILNAVLAIITVFYQPRDIAATWAWLLVLLLLPVVGLGLYLIFGRQLSTNKLNALATQRRLGIDKLVATQKEAISVGADLIGRRQAPGIPELVRTLLQTDDALVTTMNSVSIESSRERFTQTLLADIGSARSHVHLEAYAIEPDTIGLELRALLIAKAKAGVRVRVIYDTFGSHRLGAHFWRPLIAAGGQVTPFFATRAARLNPRINFRNHRKLTVIDGRVGYMGGFDIGASPHRLPIHRDLQLRIHGQAVAALQARFFTDWNTTARIKKVHFQAEYFPEPEETGQTTLQIVASGPEQADDALRLGYLRLIAMAQESIWIQTPYFVPDESLLDALIFAANAGIDVRVMVPRHTNQPLMAAASSFYIDRIVAGGGKAFYYEEGFLHAKALIVDEQVLATGTANFDIRSFKLNFELTAFVYDKILAQQAHQLFITDLENATPYQLKAVLTRPRFNRLGAELARLFAPIL